MNSKCGRLFLSIVILLLYLLSFMGFTNALTIVESEYKTWSLRYEEKITKSSAFSLRQYFGKAENGLWPTFWTEQELEYKTEYQSAEAKSIIYDGDISLIISPEFISGGYPGEQGSATIAISESLAWKLFGSTDIIGAKLRCHGGEREVVGVFKDSYADAVLFSDRCEWTCVELMSTSEKNYNDIVSIMAASNIGSGKYIVDGGGVSLILKALSFIPLITLAVAVIFLLTALKKKKRVLLRFCIIFAAFLIFAVLLPTILEAFPSWLIPTRWSDLSFWSGLFEEMKAHINEWFFLAPYSKDASAKWEITKFILCLGLNIFSIVIAYFNVKVLSFTDKLKDVT